jgi:hypothetical protein
MSVLFVLQVGEIYFATNVFILFLIVPVLLTILIALFPAVSSQY